MGIKDFFNRKKPEEQRREVRRLQMRLNRAIRQEEQRFNQIKQEQAALIDSARSDDRVARDIAKRKYTRLKIQRERVLKELRKHLKLKSVIDTTHDEFTAQRNRSSAGKIIEDMKNKAGLDAKALEDLLIDSQMDEELVTEDVDELETVLSQAADEQATDWEEAEDAEFDSIMEALSGDEQADVVKLVDRASTREPERVDPQAHR
jgi:hypothetical protein